MEEIAMTGMEYDRDLWKKMIVEKIEEYDRRW